MNYNAWVTSIYDEYEKQREEIIPRKKYTNKEFAKALTKRENISITIPLMIYAVGNIILFYLYFFDEIDNIEIYIIGLSGTFFLSLLPSWYKNEISLSSFNDSIFILDNILCKYGFDKPEVIEKFLKNTGGVFYRIKMINTEVLKSIEIFLVGGVGSLFSFELIKSDLFIGWNSMITGSLIIIIIVGIISYWVLIIVPNSRIIRKQNFHQLLKIYYVYKVYGGVIPKLYVKEQSNTSELTYKN